MNSSRHTDKKTYLKKYIQLLFMSVIIFAVLLIIVTSIKADGSNVTGNKYFMTIQIEEGDSLWSIADIYCTYDYKDYNEYIDEVKYINNMDDDNVKNGSYLVIPYYR